ncbi:hypothetical protein [Yersinia enterocolitica]|nr:hypothetical protein [Yersinia enterocolitica]
MMKKWCYLFVGIVFSFSAFAQTEEGTQKELKRYQDMKPLVEQMLRESGKLYYAMPSAASQYQQGNIDEWKNINKGLKQLDKQVNELGDNPLDPVYGSCVKMKIQLQDYWSNVIGDNEKFLERSRNQFKENRMDCFDEFVFGKEQIEARKGLVILDLTK